MVHKKTSGEEEPSHSLTSRLEVGLTLIALEYKLRKQFFLFEKLIFLSQFLIVCLPICSVTFG